MHFLNENAWWLLPTTLLGAIIAWLAFYRQQQMIASWGKNSNRFGAPVARLRFMVKGCLVGLALAAAIAALARPAIQSKHVEFQAGTVDVIVLLDVSRSMAARDCDGLSRIKRARQAMREQIIPALDRNQIGVIAYSGSAVPVVFLTEELEVAQWLVENELKISSAPGQGSAMGNAFDLAFKFFDHDSKPERKKMIVLLTDGGTDEKTSIDAIAQGCVKRDIHLVVAGFGTPQPALVPVEELSESDKRLANDLYYKVDGKPALVTLDLAVLNQLAKKVGATASFVSVTKAGDFQFKPLASGFAPKEKIGEKELYFYPCLLYALLAALAAVATARRVQPAGDQVGRKRETQFFSNQGEQK